MLNEEYENPYDFIWFFGRLTDKQAIDLLSNTFGKKLKNGNSIIYEDIFQPRHYNIAIYKDGHCHINKTKRDNADCVFLHESKKFFKLSELIDYYSKKENFRHSHISYLIGDKCLLKSKAYRPISFLGSNLSRSSLDETVDEIYENKLARNEKIARWKIERDVLRTKHHDELWYFRRKISVKQVSKYFTNGLFLITKQMQGPNQIGAGKLFKNKYKFIYCDRRRQIRTLMISQVSFDVVITMESLAMHRFPSLIQLVDYLFRAPNELRIQLMVYPAILQTMKSGVSFEDQQTEFDFGIQSTSFEKSELRIKSYIAKGGFGVVFKGILITSNKKIDVAVKMALLDNPVSDFENSCIEEGNLMKNLDHPNVVKFYGFKLLVKDNIKRVLMVYEYTNGSSLYYYTQSDRYKPDFKTINSYLKQIAMGMQYLTENGIVHRDLACRNVLLFDNDQTVKVTDFGLSKIVNKNYTYETTDVQYKPLPIYYYPPESLRDGIFNEKSDVWSFGMVCWELWNPYGEFYQTNNILEYLLKGNRLSMKKVKGSHKKLLKKCWLLDPKKRPTFQEIIKKL